MLIIGLVDHLDVSYAYTVVAPEEPQSDIFADCQASAIGVMTVLLLGGLVEPIVKEADDWRRSSRPVEEVVIRLTRGWLEEWPNDVPTPGALGWFRNTAKGNQIAEERLASERK